ncbi:MAG: sulfate ABC transporter permease subunit CysT [Candidatus Dormiibacterota bacterium]
MADTALGVLARQPAGRARPRFLGPGMAVGYLSILVLLPLAALLSNAFTGGLGTFWNEVTQAESLAALRLSVTTAAAVVAVNAVTGLVVALVLVRDDFPGKGILNAIVDLPLALPTVVAGLTLLSLYGPASPIGLNIAFTPWAILLALAFVTLPFSVRSAQPVLSALDPAEEETAASLGAGPWAIFRRVLLPKLLPAMLAGAGLGFARALGEYGSVVLISGNLPFRTELASVRIYGLVQSYDLPAAAAVALVLVLIALAVLLGLAWIRHRADPAARFA